MDTFGLIGKELFFLIGGGLLVFVASFLLGYLVVGKILNLDIRLRWALLFIVMFLTCVPSVSPAWLSSLSSRGYQELRFLVILRMVFIGLSIGQMFGGSKIHLDRKKTRRQEEEEENGESS
ncbi:MAG: hypothetical protein ABIJ82_01910 [Patescibacteria group bacterium]